MGWAVFWARQCAGIAGCVEAERRGRGRALKSAGGNDLIVYGHGRFGQALVDAGLVAELNLTIIPVFVPAGEPLFRAGGEQRRWKLIRTDEGPDPDLASLTYEPTHRKEDA